MITERDITICGHGSGNPSLKNLYDYSNTRYNSIASNGKHKGIVKVMRFKALDDTGRDKFKAKYTEILGRNLYNQNLRSYVFVPYNGKYYSDCSSSGMACLRAIGYNVSLLNTAGIYQSSLFEQVPVTIKNGHITNPEILKVGDCILFVGNDPSRPLQIGHVEYVYNIEGVSPENELLTCASNVKAIQTFLNSKYGAEIKKVIGETLKVDGSFGAKSKKAIVIGLQKELNNSGASLVIDGSFGSLSQSAFSKLVGVLSKGNKNIFVTLWQCLLVGLGFNPNGIDGSFGNGCIKATNEIFKKYSLAQDSSVSSADIRAITK